MARQLVFRFDVDTHRCLTRGTPALRALADQFDVPFTFFINMGRATSRRRVVTSLRRSGRTTRSNTPVQHLGSLRKLGLWDTMRIVTANPNVGVSHHDELIRLRNAGHELGLHGGRNHRDWQDAAPHWSEQKVADELHWGLRALRHITDQPVGFASPTWAQPDCLFQVAQTSGIAYLADDHGHDRHGVTTLAGLPSVATNILGEPGGVGFLEWHRARGNDQAAVVDDFRRRLDSITGLAVVYDHPFWAGVNDLATTETLVRIACEEGIDVVTMGHAVAQATPDR